MKIKFIFLAVILVLSTFLVACGDKKESQTNSESGENIEDDEVLVVYTTIFPLMDFTKKIGGKHVEVKNLVPVGADAHSFEPTPKTMVNVSNANLYIYNGAGIEGFAEKAAEVLKEGSVKIIKATEGVELIGFPDEHKADHYEEEEHGHENSTHKEEEHGHENDGHEEDDEHGHDQHLGGADPHVWLDPNRSIQLAENIKNALVELKPDSTDEFETNFEQLKQQLKTLDSKFKEMVDEVSRDTMIVSHAGYGYWTEVYGIKQVGIAGISPTNEPSIKQMTEVIEYAKEHQINYIILEQNIPTTIAETILTQVGAEALILHNLEALMQDDVDNNEDYFSLMERNIETLRKALQ